MTSFSYEALESSGAQVRGVIEAEDRRAALQLLGQRGLFPSQLQTAPASGISTPLVKTADPEALAAEQRSFTIGKTVKRKEISAFTREMAALLGAGIPIPQALDGLGQEEENPHFKVMLLQIADSVRKGLAISAALAEHPKYFNKLSKAFRPVFRILHPH